MRNALDSVFYCDDLNRTLTVRDYLKELLATLWRKEGFSGKRPFGNGNWQYRLYAVLIRDGFIQGSIDPESGVVNTCDTETADAFIVNLIASL